MSQQVTYVQQPKRRKRHALAMGASVTSQASAPLSVLMLPVLIINVAASVLTVLLSVPQQDSLSIHLQ